MERRKVLVGDDKFARMNAIWTESMRIGGSLEREQETTGKPSAQDVGPVAARKKQA